jgi:hypothetical protein
MLSARARVAALVLSSLLAGPLAAQVPTDFDFSISYSGQSITGRLVGLNLDMAGNGTEVDPTSVQLFHVPTIVGLSASPAHPYVFVPHTFERSTYFNGTFVSTTPGVYGFQVSNHVLTPASQNLLMIDASNDVTLVFNFGASLGGEGGVATYGIQAEEDALWPAINSFVSFTEVPTAWTAVGAGLAGSSGAPSLAGTGTLAAGSAGSLVLASAKAASPALLFVSFSSAPVAFKGGVLVAFPFVLTASFATSGAGAISLPFTWPSGVPSATSIWFQFAVQDGAALQGVALSNGLEGVTP